MSKASLLDVEPLNKVKICPRAKVLERSLAVKHARCIVLDIVDSAIQENGDIKIQCHQLSGHSFEVEISQDCTLEKLAIIMSSRLHNQEAFLSFVYNGTTSTDFTPDHFVRDFLGYKRDNWRMIRKRMCLIS